MNSELKATHLVSCKEKDYSGSPEKTKDAFSRYFARMLKKRNEENEQAVTKKDIANMLGISPELFRKYVNGEKPIKKRDCIIAICAMLQADSCDTNEALYYFDMNELEEYDKRDYILMDILDNQFSHFQSIDEINDKLKVDYFPRLDIIDHRRKREEMKTTYPYTLVRKRVEYRTDDLIFGDHYDSLDTVYCRLGRVYAYMWLDDNGHRGFKLCAEPNGLLSCTDYPMKGKWYHTYNSPDDAGIFRGCFMELQQMALIEQRKMAEYLDDTRNYHERISAKVINNELHVFYETYNYSVPELGEYYLMDYVNGVYTLYIAHKSRFMRFYLPAENYIELFGKVSDKTEEEYESIEEIETAIKDAKTDRKEIIRLRLRAFHKAQDKINSLIDSLKLGKAFIRNIGMIYDNEYDVLSYYKVTDTYQCSYDTDYGEIDGIGIDKATFTLSSGSQIELTVADLLAGFKLGLSSIEEIGVFLLEHRTLEISDLLQSGLASPKSN